MNDGRTHWDECWTLRGHHDCAVAKIGQMMETQRKFGTLMHKLMDEIDRLRDLLRQVIADEHESNWSLGTDLCKQIKQALAKEGK